jgi:hypothetical protein
MNMLQEIFKFLDNAKNTKFSFSNDDVKFKVDDDGLDLSIKKKKQHKKVENGKAPMKRIK